MPKINTIADMGDSIESMSKVLLELVREIDEKKYLIISERIKETTGIDIDLKEEQQRRFKRFLLEYKDDAETIYYNDGSVEGLRIVTFVKNGNTSPYNLTDLKVNIEYTYY